MAFADRILLNKIDLVTAPEKADVLQRLKVCCEGWWTVAVGRLVACWSAARCTVWGGGQPQWWSVSQGRRPSQSVNASLSCRPHHYPPTHPPTHPPTTTQHNTSPQTTDHINTNLLLGIPPSSLTISLQGINAAAEIIETVGAKADLDRLLGIRAFSLDRILEEEPDFLDVSPEQLQQWQ